MFAGRFLLSWATPKSLWPTVKWYRIRQDWWPGKTEHLMNHLQLQDVHRDGGLDDGHHLWYTHRKFGSLLPIVFLISEDSLGVLAQSQLLSEIYDSLKPAQYRVLHSCLGANIPAKWGMTKLGPLLFLDSFHQAAHTYISRSETSTLFGNKFRLAGWVFSLLSA